MVCSNCQQENANNARFCNGCGSPLQLACPHCGRGISPDESICGYCEQPTSESSDAPSAYSQPAAAPIAAEATSRQGGSDKEGFVGRQQEMAELKSSVDDALAGQGRIAMLVGDPGIGKTRTALELEAYANSKNSKVLWGRCYESHGAPPYWPWVQLIRTYMRECDPEALRQQMGVGAQDIAAIVPEVADYLPGTEPSSTLEDSEQARFRLFNSVTTFLKAASDYQPLTLILDNPHGADVPSLLLLEFLAEEVGRSHLLILGTYRDIEVSRQHPLFETLAQLSRVPRFQRIVLPGLTQQEVHRYITDAAGVSPSQDIVDAVHTRTEGNPLFVTEVVRLLDQEGAFVADSHASIAAQAAARSRGQGVSIPDGVREVIGRRLNRLSEGCIQTLTIASVIGREFGVSELELLIDYMTEDRLMESLEEATAARVIEESPQSIERYQYTHVLIRETLYDELAGLRRSRLHRRIGEALEDIYSGNLEPYLPQLSHHFFESGDYEKAVSYSARAAERDIALLAYEEAVRYYQTALQALALKEPVDEAAQCALYISLGDAQSRSGDYPNAMSSFSQAANVARGLGASEELAHAALGFEDASWRPGTFGGPAVTLLKEALGVLGQDESELKARLLGALARAYVFSGSYEEGISMGRNAIDMGRRLGDLDTLTHIIMGSTAAMMMPDTAEEGLAISYEVLESADERRFNGTFLDVKTWSGFYEMLLGDTQSIKGWLETYDQIATQLRQPFYLVVSACTRATLATLEGQFSSAEEYAKQALMVGKKFKGTDVSGIFGMQMFTIRKEQGRLKEVAPAFQLFVQQNSGNSVWRPGLTLVYSELGMEDEARTEFEILAKNNFEGLPRDSLWAICLSYMAEVCTFLDDKSRAKVLYDFLKPYDGYNIMTGGGIAFHGAGSRYLGMLASTMSQWDIAEKHFEDAIKMDTQTSSATWLAHTNFEYGKMLHTRGLQGDSERSTSLLQKALEMAKELGMRSLEENAMALLDRNLIQIGERLIANPYPDNLTEREVEVLQHVAAGKSNREISEDLFITQNTVANHVKNILSKTASANRTEAARYAMLHGIIDQ